MSEDARNALVVWGMAIGLFGFMWLNMQYKFVPHIPLWVSHTLASLFAIKLAWDGARSLLARRRARVIE